MKKLVFPVLGALLVVGIWVFQQYFNDTGDMSDEGVGRNVGASSETSKKRLAPAETEALVVDGIRYEAPKWGKSLGLGQNGGHLRAVDESTGNELWVLEVYEIVYDGDMEDDKLDRFITTISLSGQGRLRINSERCGVYLVDRVTQKVTVERHPPC